MCVHSVLVEVFAGVHYVATVVLSKFPPKRAHRV